MTTTFTKNAPRALALRTRATRAAIATLFATLFTAACEEEQEPTYQPATFEALRFSEVSQPIEGVSFDEKSISLIEGVPVRVTIEARLDGQTYGTDRNHYFGEEDEDGTYFELQSDDATIVDVSETQESRGNGGCATDQYGYNDCYGATGVFEYIFIPRRAGETRLIVIWRDEVTQELPMSVSQQPGSDDDDDNGDDDDNDNGDDDDDDNGDDDDAGADDDSAS